MTLSRHQLENLQAAFDGVAVDRAAPTGNPEQRYHVGAVWYGNWWEKADGGRFGSEKKPRHNACLKRRSKCKSYFTFAPITSEKRKGADILVLREGTIPGGECCVSYLLAKFKLIAQRRTLDEHFEHKCNLSSDIVQAMKEAEKK